MISNLISLYRIAVLPIIIYLTLQQDPFYSLLSLGLFILAILSDILDGYIARQRKETTRVGSFLDPLADKTLLFGLLITFTLLGTYWWIPVLIFIARDIVVGIIHWFASQEDVSLEFERYSHLMTYFKFIIVFGLLLEQFLILDNFFPPILPLAGATIAVFTLLAVILAFLSAIHYGGIYLKGLHGRIKKGTKLQKENLVILANKKSRGYHDGYRRRLLKIFSKRRKAKIRFLPGNRKNMFQGIEKTIEKSKQVIIAGGDGSFEGALNYKPLRNKSLGFFPFGAGNAYYSYFYKGKRFEYLRSRFHFNETKLDILEVEWDKGKTQTTFLAAGVDAEVIRLSKHRTQYGLKDYLVGTIKALRKSKADYDLTCTIDGKKHDLENTVNLTIAKIPYYGFAMRSLLGKVDADDGKVYGLACVNSHHEWLNKPVRIWSLVLAALNLNKNPLLPLKGKKFIVESEVPFPIQAGGEFLGFTEKLKVKVKRKQKVLMI